MTDKITQDRQGGVLELCLNRPDKLNALDAEMYAALADSIDAAERDAAVRVVLLHGAGSAFCAGNDLREFVANPPQGADSPLHRFLRALSGARKIVVAAVHGAAVGIGTTMLLHCDFVLAGSSAKLVLPFVNLGLVPEFASSLLLPRIVGRLKASELFLLGDPVDATTALSLRLVNRVVDDTTLLASARAVAVRIAASAPESVRLTKQLLKGGSDDITRRMAEEAALFERQLASAEFREAASAFFEKRRPDFSKLS